MCVCESVYVLKRLHSFHMAEQSNSLYIWHLYIILHFLYICVKDPFNNEMVHLKFILLINCQKMLVL